MKSTATLKPFTESGKESSKKIAESLSHLLADTYVLYIVKKGEKLNKDRINLIGDHFLDLPKIYWQNSKMLNIGYSSGNVSHFSDSAFFNKKTGDYDIKIRLTYP